MVYVESIESLKQIQEGFDILLKFNIVLGA